MTALLERLYPNIDLRIILPFLLLIVVTAIIAVFIVTSLTANTIQERLDNQLRDSAQIAEDSLTQLEGEYLAALRLMAFTEGVDEAIIGSDFERLETTLRGIIANEQLDDVVVFNILAEPVIRISRSSFPPPNYDADVNLPSRLDWETVQNVLAGVADNQGDKFVDIISYDDFSVVYFVAPVRNEQNEIVGGIAAGISELNLLRLLTNQALAEVALYFDDSQLLISSFVDETAFINQTTPAVQTLLAQAPNTESPIEEITVNDVPYQILFT
ncbi:MAG: cache domain-containing protein, partial [Chloroflexota bacterium]